MVVDWLPPLVLPAVCAWSEDAEPLVPALAVPLAPLALGPTVGEPLPLGLDPVEAVEPLVPLELAAAEALLSLEVLSEVPEVPEAPDVPAVSLRPLLEPLGPPLTSVEVLSGDCDEEAALA
jgi:hypothetical protein